jgi:hypothetical protein
VCYVSVLSFMANLSEHDEDRRGRSKELDSRKHDRRHSPYDDKRKRYRDKDESSRRKDRSHSRDENPKEKRLVYFITPLYMC